MLNPATIALLNLNLVAAVSLDPGKVPVNGEELIAPEAESDESTAAADSSQ